MQYRPLCRFLLFFFAFLSLNALAVEVNGVTVDSDDKKPLHEQSVQALLLEGQGKAELKKTGEVFERAGFNLDSGYLKVMTTLGAYNDSLQTSQQQITSNAISLLFDDVIELPTTTEKKLLVAGLAQNSDYLETLKKQDKVFGVIASIVRQALVKANAQAQQSIAIPLFEMTDYLNREDVLRAILVGTRLFTIDCRPDGIEKKLKRVTIVDKAGTGRAEANKGNALSTRKPQKSLSMLLKQQASQYQQDYERARKWIGENMPHNSQWH